MKSKTKTQTKNNTACTSKSKFIWVGVISLAVGLAIGWGAGSYFAHHSFIFSELECLDGAAPDKNGCCPGELYTDMGDQGYNCCPEAGGDCFPPLGK